MSDTIIAVDLGRHKSVACVYDRRSGAHAFRELDTTPGALDRLLAAHLVRRATGLRQRRGYAPRDYRRTFRPAYEAPASLEVLGAASGDAPAGGTAQKTRRGQGRRARPVGRRRPPLLAPGWLGRAS